MSSREMKNDTPEQPRVEPGVRRLPALRGAERGEGRESDSGRQLGALEIPQVRVPAGSRARRRGDGFPSLRPSSLRHTPFPGPRSPPARVRRGQSLSFPGPVAAGWVPGSPVGAREVSPSLSTRWANVRTWFRSPQTMYKAECSHIYLKSQC